MSGLLPYLSANHPHGRLNNNRPAANALIVAPISVAFAPSSCANIGNTGLAHACPDINAAEVRHTLATAPCSRKNSRARVAADDDDATAPLVARVVVPSPSVLAPPSSASSRAASDRPPPETTANPRAGVHAPPSTRESARASVRDAPRPRRVAVDAVVAMAGVVARRELTFEGLVRDSSWVTTRQKTLDPEGNNIKKQRTRPSQIVDARDAPTRRRASNARVDARSRRP